MIEVLGSLWMLVLRSDGVIEHALDEYRYWNYGLNYVTEVNWMPTTVCQYIDVVYSRRLCISVENSVATVDLQRVLNLAEINNFDCHVLHKRITSLLRQR